MLIGNHELKKKKKHNVEVYSDCACFLNYFESILSKKKIQIKYMNRQVIHQFKLMHWSKVHPNKISRVNVAYSARHWIFENKC